MEKKNETNSRRRSTRLKEQAPEDKVSLYAMDRMNQNELQQTLLYNEMRKSEAKMVKYAIERSLITETKYNDAQA